MRIYAHTRLPRETAASYINVIESGGVRMRWSIGLLSMWLLLSGVAVGQTTGEGCGAIDDSAKRMICYDALFRTATSTPVIEGTGAWNITTETSRITDTTNVFVTLESDQPIPARFGGGGQKAVLNLRCRENTTSFTIWFGGQFMASSGGFDRVTYRIDDRPAVDDRWEESTNNEHMGHWSGGRSIPLIKSLFGAQNLLVRATPFNESAITIDFKVGGIEAAIEPLREACGW